MLDSGNIKIDRYNPPLSKELPVFKFPAYNKEMLPDNISVYIIEDNTQPLLSIRLLIKGGATTEPIQGLSGFTSQLIVKGTKKRTAAQIAEETDYLGFTLNSASGWDDSTISLIGLSEYIDKGLDILSDCILEPAFSENEIERLKKKHISNIHQEYADPSYLVQAAFNSAFYTNHPYGHPSIGTPDTINSITRQDCEDWFSKLINESGIYIIVAGNIAGKDIYKLLKKYLGKLKYNGEKEIKIAEPEMTDMTHIAVVNKPDISQTTLKIGKPSIGRKNPDFSHLQIVNTIFGGFFLSRLNYLLREVHGYTYGIHSSVESRKHFSALTVGTNINKDATSIAVEEIISEMSRISLNAVTDEELYRAVQYVLGSFVRVVETPQQVSTLLQSIIANDLPEDYFDEFFKSVAVAKKEELLEIQRKYLKPEHLIISAVGESEFLTNALGRFGEIKMCDASGNIVS